MPSVSSSTVSSRSRSGRGESQQIEGNDSFDADSIPVEMLVQYLLAAKHSLSTMAFVLRANDLTMHARRLHEDSIILGAQTGFLQNGINEQVRVLRRLRRSLKRAHMGGRRDFKHLLRTLDGVDAELEQTMTMLRQTPVESVFRPEGEDTKCLMDFVDEQSVDGLRDALKKSLAGLQSAQTSFDGDLFRFDDDLRSLGKTISSAALPSFSVSKAYQSMPHLLALLTNNSHDMAEHLTSLTRHFDMCVTAVRSTEGGAALARRKAAEVSEGGDPVSISGVIGDQESHLVNLEPMSPHERAEVVQVVVQDAPEVAEVVKELETGLHQVESHFAALKEQADYIRQAYLTTVAAIHVLEEIGSRLVSYVSAESEYTQRWEDEKEVIFSKLEEMEELRRFYEGYASAYDSLILEVERRRTVRAKIQNILRKARDHVDKLIEGDKREREHFRDEIGDFLPTDLWVGMNKPLGRWDMVPVDDVPDLHMKDITRSDSTPILGKAVVEAAKERLGRSNRAA